MDGGLLLTEMVEWWCLCSAYGTTSFTSVAMMPSAVCRLEVMAGGRLLSYVRVGASERQKPSTSRYSLHVWYHYPYLEPMYHLRDTEYNKPTLSRCQLLCFMIRSCSCSSGGWWWSMMTTQCEWRSERQVVGDLMIDVDYLEFVFMDSSHLSVVYWWLVLV